MLRTWPSFTPAACAATSACSFASATARRMASSRTGAPSPFKLACPLTVIPGADPPEQHHDAGTGPQAITVFVASIAGQAIPELPDDAPGTGALAAWFDCAP